MIKDIDIIYSRDTAPTLGEFLEQYNISPDDSRVIVQDFFLREYKLKDFHQYNRFVYEAGYDKNDDSLTICLIE